MLRKDPKGGYKSHPAGFFSKKLLWRFYSGNDHTKGEKEEEEYQAIMREQKHTPVAVMWDEATKKCWWMFMDSAWCENEGYTQDELRALILDKIEQKNKKIKRAVARVDQNNVAASIGREIIPDHVKSFVWQRR